MSMKNFVWMFAIGVCLCLGSAQTASACANDRLSHDSHEHAARAGKSVTHTLAAPGATLRSEPEASRPASKIADAKSPAAKESVKAAAATTATLQDDEFDMEGGSCIHGCSCAGRKSHIRGCGTNADCHAHEGLVCTWASSSYAN